MLSPPLWYIYYNTMHSIICKELFCKIKKPLSTDRGLKILPILILTIIVNVNLQAIEWFAQHTSPAVKSFDCSIVGAYT
jgi:hypothetical protein